MTYFIHELKTKIVTKIKKGSIIGVEILQSSGRILVVDILNLEAMMNHCILLNDFE